MKPLSRILACLAAALAVAGGAAAESLHGRVASVIDGGTLAVDVAGRGQWRVRLAWVAAPARLQAHGEAARASLGALAYGRAVRLDDVQPDAGEWRAQVWVAPPGMRCGNADCPPTLDLGLAQLERGMAWHDRRRHGQAPAALSAYQQAEFAAKIRRQGLWSGKNPSPPWEWRGPR